MNAPRVLYRLPALLLLVGGLSGCNANGPARPHPLFLHEPRINSGGAALDVNWAVNAVMSANGTTIRGLKLNYGFTMPGTVPSLYRVADYIKYEHQDPPICVSLPCTEQVNPNFYAPGDNLPAGQVVHFNVEVRYSIAPDDATMFTWWSPTKTGTPGN